MKVIESEWERFKKTVLPPDAGPIQINETRKAFYAGAGCLFLSIMQILGPGQEATESDLAIMDGINTELDEFLKSAQREAELAALKEDEIEVHNKRPDLGKLDSTCNKTGCGKPSKWQVALVFFAKGHTKPHEGMRAEMTLALCNDCGKTAKAEDFLTDEGFQKVVLGCRMWKKADPERSLTRVELLPILLGNA
jgi:hypothetical protein